MCRSEPRHAHGDTSAPPSPSSAGPQHSRHWAEEEAASFCCQQSSEERQQSSSWSPLPLPLPLLAPRWPWRAASSATHLPPPPLPPLSAAAAAVNPASPGITSTTAMRSNTMCMGARLLPQQQLIIKRPTPAARFRKSSRDRVVHVCSRSAPHSQPCASSKDHWQELKQAKNEGGATGAPPPRARAVRGHYCEVREGRGWRREPRARRRPTASAGRAKESICGACYCSRAGVFQPAGVNELERNEILRSKAPPGSSSWFETKNGARQVMGVVVQKKGGRPSRPRRIAPKQHPAGSWWCLWGGGVGNDFK